MMKFRKMISIIMMTLLLVPNVRAEAPQTEAKDNEPLLATEGQVTALLADSLSLDAGEGVQSFSLEDATLPTLLSVGEKVQVFHNKADASFARSVVRQALRTLRPDEAAPLLALEDDRPLLLDVRTQAEFDAGHLSGAMLLPDFEIEAMAEEKLPDKDATILVYCRSGNRSRQASLKLMAMGYTDVLDIGGIGPYWDSFGAR